MKHKLIALFIVVLACCIHAQSSVISIDGDFSDWKILAEEERVLAEPDENSCYFELSKLMLTQDSDYIYFYLEFYAEGTEFYIPQLDKMVKGYYVDNFDFFLDLDNDSTTGANFAFKESAAEWLIEGSWQNFNEAGLFPCDTLSPQNEWGYYIDTTISISCVVASEASILDNENRAFEGKIAKNMIPGIVSDSLRIGVLALDTKWDWYGLLPQCTFLENGYNAYSQMLTVPYLHKDLDVTAVEHVQSADVQCTKVIRDGQLFIEYEGRRFNAQGVQVK